MKTAAIYSRVSSDRQKEEQTIASQTAALVEYAQAEGYSVPSEWIFQDEGYSGSVLVRPGLERLRDLVAEGQVGTVLVYSPDRLSRKYAYQVLLMEDFSRHGAEVVFVKSPPAATPEDRLLLQFQGMIAEYERAQIAERTRRGKRHRAKAGSISVLNGAPYGYRYVKKTEVANAFYEVIDDEAAVVRDVYRLFTEEASSIGAVVRWLQAQNIPTRKRKAFWERATVWGMLRNPAYKGTACFGKTERAERGKINRTLRQRGGFSPRCGSEKERPREDWIEIPVPAIVSEATFALAQERLQSNKRFSLRHTIEPTLLQGMLICSLCGYACRRTSARPRSSTRRIYYYRCLSSDTSRHYNGGRACGNPSVRQDYLDDIVWKQIVRLLENPELIRVEIDRRVQDIRESNPTKIRKDDLAKEDVRVQKGIDRLLDAYQEGLLPLENLRERMPLLRKRAATLKSELKTLEANAIDQEKIGELAGRLEEFLERLRKSAQSLDVRERQRILRLVVKEIHLGPETLTIKHSIPIPGPSGTHEVPGYVLCKRSQESVRGRPRRSPRLWKNAQRALPWSCGELAGLRPTPRRQERRRRSACRWATRHA